MLAMFIGQDTDDVGERLRAAAKLRGRVAKGDGGYVVG